MIRPKEFCPIVIAVTFNSINVMKCNFDRIPQLEKSFHMKIVSPFRSHQINYNLRNKQKTFDTVSNDHPTQLLCPFTSYCILLGLRNDSCCEEYQL